MIGYGSALNTSSFPIDGDAVPHAIFWRPLVYFSQKIFRGEDGLDSFRFISFSPGNYIKFDLRTYRRNDLYTSTFYLENIYNSQRDILEILNFATKRLVVPKSSIAWRRGDPFEFGKILRPKSDRLRESEARLLALKIASQFPDHIATTEQLKNHIPLYSELSATDLEPSTSRRREQRWQQIVGNVISHRDSESSLFRTGLARRTHDGLQVTEKGIIYLNSIGFSASDPFLTE